MRIVSINWHIYFLFHFMIFTFHFTTAGYSASALKIHSVAFLLHKTYHNGTIKATSVEIPHHTRIESSLIRLGFTDNASSFSWGAPVIEPAGKSLKKNVSQIFPIIIRQGSLYFRTRLKNSSAIRLQLINIPVSGHRYPIGHYT